MACLLWESGFYEEGKAIAQRLSLLVRQTDPEVVAALVLEARNQMKLRHAPLLIVREMARLPRHKGHVKRLLSEILQRPDELAEFLALYWQEKKQPLSAQVKKGLAMAFGRFDEYQLAKWDRRGTAIQLRDVLFLCHAKPKDAEQEALWQRLIYRNLAIPDTWEVALSSGGDKRSHWERLLRDNRLGALALLRNLRNMDQAGVTTDLVQHALANMRTAKVLPFRFIAAARHAPQWEESLEKAMLRCLKKQTPLPGHTVLLLDVSGSMEWRLSARSELNRMESAIGLAMLIREICQKVDIFTFSNQVVRIPARRGFALGDAIRTSQDHMGTFLGVAVQSITSHHPVAPADKRHWGNAPAVRGWGLSPDRLIVLTDEQSHDPVPSPRGRGYMINVASNKNGVGYHPWIHIDGWSEAIVDYMRAYEEQL
jgi:hypothetical protein